MTGLSRLASLWRNLFRRTHVERDLDAELHGHRFVRGIKCRTKKTRHGNNRNLSDHLFSFST